MGIDISAKLLYGTPYSDLPEEIREEVDEMLDDGELEYASPYYDAHRREWIVGVDSEGIGYAVTDAESELPDIIKSNCSCGTYVTPHVS